MTSATLSDIHGTIRVSVNDMNTYIKTWFKHNHEIVLIAIPKGVSGRDSKSYSMKVNDFLDWSDDDLYNHIFEMGGGADLYFAVCPVKKPVKYEDKGRGGEENVERVLGTWADIDVKTGGFSSTEEIVEWLHGLEAPPTMIVGSGSGGIHAYWRLKGDDGNKELIERWWAYLDEAAGENRKIDRLIDTARMLRIPGTVYFPKEGVKLGQVVLLEASGVEYDKETLVNISADAFRVKIMKRRETVRVDNEKRKQVEEHFSSILTGSAGNKWSTMSAVAHIEDYVNETFTWEEILEPQGWTLLGQKRDDREWARPFQNERSATTDYTGDGDTSVVMALHSAAEETGLADLKEAGIILTKYRVALRLTFGDDPQLMIDSLLPRMKEDGVI